MTLLSLQHQRCMQMILHSILEMGVLFGLTLMSLKQLPLLTVLQIYLISTLLHGHISILYVYMVIYTQRHLGIMRQTIKLRTIMFQSLQQVQILKLLRIAKGISQRSMQKLFQTLLQSLIQQSMERQQDLLKFQILKTQLMEHPVLQRQVQRAITKQCMTHVSTYIFL